MEQAKLSGVKKVGTNKIVINLQVFFFQEDDIFFAYMPSLDLTGYGNTPKEAKDSLTVVLDEFLKYTINKNTFLIELKRLGWKIKSKKKPMHAPQMTDLINSNEQLKEIVNSKQYSTSNYPVKVPILQ
jgi:hypothetical protein